MASASQSQSRGPTKGGRKRNENNVIYANPLPITFSPIENRLAVAALGLFGVSPIRVLNPRCEGTFDPVTRSVWITSQRDSMTLWRRGFFGKGNLSRSEPSWLARQSHLRRKLRVRLRAFMYTHRFFVLETTSEEVTAKRRAERKQFKLDRARAIAAAAAEAEAAFSEGRIISAEETKASIPSAATWKPSDLTRNVASPSGRLEQVTDLSAEPLEDMEHMQLTLPEAFFLAWALGCLTIYHPKTVRPHRMSVYNEP
jgi:tRNA-splicing endonuclease subunit Sen2